jgi:hypothetical protein
MPFSNTTNKNGLIQRCEDYTGIGDGNISGDSTTLLKFTSHINEALYDVIVEIMRAQDSFDWDDSNNTDYPIGTFPLTTNRDYSLPTSLKFLTLKRVDISWDGVNYYRATPVDSSEILVGMGNADHEDAYFDRTQPQYDPKSNGFWLYPRATSADVAAGAKARIEFTREFDEFTSADTTQEPGIDRPFHDLVAIGASFKWAVAKDAPKAKNLKVLWDEGMAKMAQHYSRKNKDAQLVFNPQVDTYA